MGNKTDAEIKEDVIDQTPATPANDHRNADQETPNEVDIPLDPIDAPIIPQHLSQPDVLEPALSVPTTSLDQRDDEESSSFRTDSSFDEKVAAPNESSAEMALIDKHTNMDMAHIRELLAFVDETQSPHSTQNLSFLTDSIRIATFNHHANAPDNAAPLNVADILTTYRMDTHFERTPAALLNVHNQCQSVSVYAVHFVV